jgi:antitoxin (DNA-binding transcriptional repressor) of toxin-antitoxin stability system
MSIRDLRNRPGEIQKTLPGETVALTSSGKPFALVVGVDEDDLLALEAAIRQAKTQRAVSKMRVKAANAGLDALSMNEIDEEIKAARAESPRS